LGIPQEVLNLETKEHQEMVPPHMLNMQYQMPPMMMQMPQQPMPMQMMYPQFMQQQ
jgi:hypothetical protein